MKKFLSILFLISFFLPLTIVLPISTQAGAVFANDVVISASSASSKFQEELNNIQGLNAQNARLTFSDDGVVGYAYPVTTDMLKIQHLNTNGSPFVGTTAGTMEIHGVIYAQNGKIGFTQGTLIPATLNIFHIENAVHNAINSFVGTNYIGSAEIRNGQVIAHVIEDPNKITTNSDSNVTKTDTFKGGIVPDCNKTGDTTVDGYYLRFTNPCDFGMLVSLINRFIKFLIVYFATPLAAIIFAYAGFTYITSGGSSEKAKHAKAMIMKVFVGYIVALAAYLIINTILAGLGFPSNWSFL